MKIGDINLAANNEYTPSKVKKAEEKTFEDFLAFADTLKKNDLKADKCVMYEKSKIDSCLECEARGNCMRFIESEQEAEKLENAAERRVNELENYYNYYFTHIELS